MDVTMEFVCGLGNSIVSQLAACEANPGIWEHCPPRTPQADAELSHMIAHRLVRWRDVVGGYEITPLGQGVLNRAAALPSPQQQEMK